MFRTASKGHTIFPRGLYAPQVPKQRKRRGQNIVAHARARGGNRRHYRARKKKAALGLLTCSLLLLLGNKICLFGQHRL